MNQVIAWLHHPASWALIYAGFNLLVDTMPEPLPSGGNGYLWLYRLLHAAAMNIKTARGLKMMVPQGAATSPIDGNAVVVAAEQTRKPVSGYDRFKS